MAYVGDIASGARVEMDPICTTDTSGVPTAATSMSVCVRRAGQNTLAPAGVAMTTSGASYFISIFTASAAGYYLTANDYSVFVGNGTVGSTLIAGYPVGSFSIENRSALRPTVAARTLSVDATGRVELIAIAGGTVSATTGVMNVNVTQWQGIAPLNLIGSRVDAHTSSISVGALQQFFTTSTGLWADAQANSIVKQVRTTSVDANVTTWVGIAPNALISGRVDANAQAIANGAIASATFSANAIDSAALAATAATEIADAILARSLAAESYAADGAVPTLSEMQYMIYSALAQFAVISTSIVTYKLDGSSVAMSFSIDSATTPTLRIRTG